MKVYVVIDVGCFECGVSTIPIGIFKTKRGAEGAAQRQDDKTGNWRDGGQSGCEVFAMEVPV